MFLISSDGAWKKLETYLKRSAEPHNSPGALPRPKIFPKNIESIEIAQEKLEERDPLSLKELIIVKIITTAAIFHPQHPNINPPLPQQKTIGIRSKITSSEYRGRDGVKHIEGVFEISTK